MSRRNWKNTSYVDGQGSPWLRKADETMGFGKYEHSIIMDVANDDPNYILWALRERSSFGIFNKGWAYNKLPEKVRSVNSHKLIELGFDNINDFDDERDYWDI